MFSPLSFSFLPFFYPPCVFLFLALSATVVGY